MKLVATLGYQIVIFPPDVNTGMMIEALSKCSLGKQDYVGNRYVYRTEEGTIELKLVSDDDVCLPENTNQVKPMLDRIVELQSQLSKEQQNYYKLKQDFDAINKKIATLTEEKK